MTYFYVHKSNFFQKSNHFQMLSYVINVIQRLTLLFKSFLKTRKFFYHSIWQSGFHAQFLRTVGSLWQGQKSSIIKSKNLHSGIECWVMCDIFVILNSAHYYNFNDSHFFCKIYFKYNILNNSYIMV